MKIRKLLFSLLAIICIAGQGYGQTNVLLESFDNASKYTVTLGAEGNDGSNDYFHRTDGSNIGKSYTGAVNTNFFAGQDIDDGGWTGSASPSQLTWSSLNIVGLTNLSFSGLFASSALTYIDAADYLLVEYRIDAGSWVNLIAFENDGTSSNTYFLEDTDFDGDGDGTQLTDSFANFSKNIVGTGAQLDIRITVALNAGDEDFAIDEFKIEGTSSVINPEPTNHVTLFTATENGSTQIDLSWVDAVAGAQAPAGYYIYANTNSGSLATPVDGTEPTVDTDLSDGSAIINVAGGVQAHSFTGLAPNTQYFFQVWSYTNSGVNIDFKTSPVGPTANATTDAAAPEGLQLLAINIPAAIDFDNTVNGVNNGAFDGSGFAPSPAAGQINSNTIKVTGMSDGSLAFGGIGTSGDFARGTSSGGVGTGGIYAFDIDNSGNMALGVQPGGNDFTPGAIVLKLQNQTGGTINNLRVAYTIYVNNDQGRANSFNFAHSADDSTYIDIAALDYTSTEASGANEFVAVPKVAVISGLNIANGAYYYFQWNSDDVSGGGNRDEFAIDDIEVTAYDGTVFTYNGAWDVDPSGVATANDYINVETSGATITGATSCKGLIVQAGATLDLGANTLTVADTAFIKANTSAYGQIIGAVSGTANVQTVLNDDADARWFNIAFPVDATLATVKAGGDASRIITTANNGGNSNSVNIAFYDATALDGTSGQGTWTRVAAKTAQTEGVGYSVYFGAPYFGSLPVTIDVTGTLLNGNQSIATGFVGAGANQGWNLIPNPYASTLNFTSVYNNNANVDATYYISNGDGTVSSYNANLATGIGATQYIAPMQAFFVKLTSAGNISMANIDRDITQAPAKHKTNIDFLGLTATNKSNSREDKVFVAFKSGLTDGKDNTVDGYKMFNGKTENHNLFVDYNGDGFAYYGIDNQFASKSIDVFFNAGADGDFEIALDATRINSNWTVLLEDKLNNTTVDMRLGSYAFSHNTSNAENRFVLHINTNAVGTEELADANGIFAYTEGSALMVNLEQAQGISDIFLYDLNGKLLLKRTNVSNAIEAISMGRMAAGTYVLKVAQGEEVVYVQKIIK